MPELPEVEITKRAIEPFITAQTIKKITIRHYQLRWAIPENLSLTLKNKTIRALTRRGKYLLFHFDHGTLLLHLGMSGSLHLHKEPKKPQKHDHVDFLFSNGMTLRLRDPRRFGALLWSESDPTQHPLLKHLGPEPLSNALSVEYLFARSRSKKVSIKNFLMNSKIVTGIGNIYAQEALFLAGVRPSRKAGKLNLQDYEKLLRAIRKVLQAAIKQGGTTFRDFISPEGKPGYFSMALKVYGREGEPCLVCKSTLKQVRIGNRSTVYCAKCQN